MPDRLQDVVQHQVCSRDKLTLGVGGVVSQVRCLKDQLSANGATTLKLLARTHSVKPRISLASQIAAAATNDGGAAMSLHSRHWISSRYLAIVLTWTL